MSHTSSYRPDIDGLRAIAVLSVMAFHFGEYLSGGFIGVDIFFVISGFLITQIILRSLEQGTFSFKDFYIRRIKRIVPVFYTVCCFAMIAGYFIIPPFEYMQNAQTLIAAVLNVSNLYFWKTFGYFDMGGEYKIFLHTWSLTVEEQFYWGFPAFLYISYRFFKQHMIYMFWMLCLGSLGLSLYFQIDKPASNFYLLPMRMWELGAGSLLAYHKPQLNISIKISNIIKTICFLTLILLCFFYDKEIIFPGMSAIPVIVATIGFLMCSEKSLWITRLLSLRSIVWVGKISYSLYLWHWVILVLTMLIIGLNPFSYCLMVILSFAFATFSYYFIENPCRFATARKEKYILYGCGFATMILLASGYYIQKQKGIFHRFNTHTQKAFKGQFEKTALGENKTCSESLADIDDIHRCRFGNFQPNHPPKTLIWGDSHGGALAHGIVRSAKLHKKDLLIRSMGGCLPTTGKIFTRSAFCGYYNQNILKLIKKNKFDTIILIGYWAKYYNHDNSYLSTLNLYDRDNKYNISEGRAKFEQDFKELMHIFSKTTKKIFVIDAVPTYSFHVPEYLGRDGLYNLGRTQELEKMRLTHTQYLSNNKAFKNLAGSIEGVNIIEPAPILCPSSHKFCLMQNQKTGDAYYQDSNHLTRAGSLKLMPLYEKIWDK